MVAIARNRPFPVQPVGYEVFDKGTATEAMSAGQPVVQTAAGWSLAPAGSSVFHGLAAMDYYAGQGGCDFMIQGEMDGYTGLTPGVAAYVSGTVAGGLDTTAPVYYTAATTPVVNVPAVPQARAVTTTRIRVNCV